MTFEAPPPRSRILVAVLALLFLTGAVPLVLLVVVSNFNRDRLEVQQKEQQLLLAESIAREVSEFVAGKRLELQGMAAGLSAALDTGDPTQEVPRESIAAVANARVPGLLKSYSEGDDDLLRLMFAMRASGTAGGQVDYLLASRTTDTNLLAAAEELLVSVLLEKAFAGAAALGAPAGPSPVLVVAVPVRRGEKVEAVLAAIVDLSSLGDRVEGPSRQLYSVFVTDPTGSRLLARSSVRADEPELLGSALVDSFRQVRGTRTMPFRAVVGGRERAMLGAYATEPATGFGVFVQANAEAAYYLVRKLQETTILWSMLLVLGALLLGSLFAQRLVQPIHQLAEGAMRLARGDFSKPIRIASRNELGLLAGSFNHMAGEIERQLLDLEHAASENKELFLSSIRMLTEAIDEKDPYTRGHSERVTRFAVATARSLGLSAEEVERVQVGALLHDVGKIGVDDRILRKPAALTDEEFEVMKQHPDRGAHIMGAVPQLKDIVPAMRFHHEKLDGTGYPLGLKGDEIPLAAQIVSVADTFDAMTTDRPYQRGMDPEFVVGKLKEWIGTRFRADVVDAFERAFRSGTIEVKRRGPVPRPGPPSAPPVSGSPVSPNPVAGTGDRP